MSDNSPHKTIIACISNSVSSMLGKGSRAAMREAGKQIWPELPANVGFDEAARIMHDGISQLEGFGEFMLKSRTEDGGFEIEFKNCGFSKYTAKSGEPCGEQAICFFGFGLVEETLFRLTGTKYQVKLAQRDEGCNMCHEVAIPR